MRQAGVLAAAGLYALSYHVERLADDHRRARALAEGLAALPGLELDPSSVATNIVIAQLAHGLPAPAALCQSIASEVRALPFGARAIRFVTHLDVDDDDVDRAVVAVARALGGG